MSHQFEKCLVLSLCFHVTSHQNSFNKKHLVVTLISHFFWFLSEGIPPESYQLFFIFLRESSSVMGCGALVVTQTILVRFSCGAGSTFLPRPSCRGGSTSAWSPLSSSPTCSSTSVESPCWKPMDRRSGGQTQPTRNTFATLQSLCLSSGDRVAVCVHIEQNETHKDENETDNSVTKLKLVRDESFCHVAKAGSNVQSFCHAHTWKHSLNLVCVCWYTYNIMKIMSLKLGAAYFFITCWWGCQWQENNDNENLLLL